ncbi:MAG TPA: hypothetical protein VKZ49_06115, partial [Polyangiaceae bacterium]|nr:hypothetical protein [Polyangiaceae bacterium]
MLILLQPSDPLPGPDLARLARLTGLSAYDLKTRIRAGAWGVVKALADLDAAEQLLASLRQEGFGAVAVPTRVAYEAERHAVPVRGIALEPEQLVLRLSERDMPVPYAAVAALVRGEVQVGRRLRPRSASSATLRLATPAEDTSGSGDVYPAMDIHFFTVAWFAR